MTTLNDLYDQQGQSPWLDNLRRDWLEDGTMADMVAKGIRGVTSNPTIFANAISGQDTYDKQFGELIRTKSVEDAYWDPGGGTTSTPPLALFRPVYDASDGGDGFISVEVAPSLAHDTDGTIAMARDLPCPHRPAQRAGQDSGHRGGSACHPADDQRGQEHQRDPHLQHHPLRRGHRGLPVGSRGAARLRAWRISPTWPASPPSSSAGWTPRSTGASKRRHRPATPAAACSTSGGGQPWPRPDWPTSCSPTGSPDRAGRHWQPRGRTCSDRCGPRPRPRNPDYPDLAYVDSLIGPHTVNTMPDGTVADFLDHGTVPPDRRHRRRSGGQPDRRTGGGRYRHGGRGPDPGDRRGRFVRQVIRRADAVAVGQSRPAGPSSSPPGPVPARTNHPPKAQRRAT